ncbi:MAG: cytochrome c peroxidase [Paraglaciecola sp.]|jgi:cytochrome c peroxidase
MKNRLLITAFFSILFLSFWWVKQSLFYVPTGFPEPLYDISKNLVTEEKALLGRALFHDAILSRDNTVSCTTCHSQYTAFTHTDHDLSHGIEDRIGTRNSPALMNLAWQSTFMWDGAVNHLDVQALAPISSHDEMDSSMEEVVGKLQVSTIYPSLFQAAFGDSIVTGEHTLKAISAFMLTFISANSKYDQMKRGAVEFTIQEQNGYQLFQKSCASCHAEPLFTTNEFANNGLSVDTTLNDFGRMTVTNNSADSLKFKIPTLRNIEFSYPYMHDGRFRKLPEVLKHYNNIKHSATLASSLQNLMPLTSNERVDLLAFLLTLTDREFLFNRGFGFPREVLLGE